VLSRPRRLRTSQAMRDLVADVSLEPQNLILPLFVKEGIDQPQPVPTMPGVVQHSEQSILSALDEAIAVGLKAVMIFAVPLERDATGSVACQTDGILNRVIRNARAHAGDSLVLIADLCLDEFTDHGHCGVLDASGAVDNDATVSLYCQMAVELGRAGADLLGTSGMMDGQVGHIRVALDQAGLVSTGVLAYAAKFASGFYGPFRQAVESQFAGDRKGYQQDYRRTRESELEIRQDISEGADIVMVKPALAYLDIVRAAAEISEVPVAAYLVSGEYAMVEAAAAAGVLDRDAAIFEMLYALRRAGAQLICTYWALEFARKIAR